MTKALMVILRLQTELEQLKKQIDALERQGADCTDQRIALAKLEGSLEVYLELAEKSALS